MIESFHLTLTAEHPIIRQHQVYNQPLLPGLAYIDILYQLAAQLELDYGKWALRRLAISSPLTVSRGRPVELNVTFEQNAGIWRLKAEGERTDDTGRPQPPLLYMTAELHPQDVRFDGRLDAASVCRSASRRFDMEQVYAQARSQGLVHAGAIKALGELHADEQGVLIKIRLDEAFAEDADNYLFHPALIDGAAMAAGALFGNEGGEEELYLPLYYESFACVEPMRSEVYVRAFAASVKIVNEIRTMDIGFYDAQGRQIGELQGITGKKIRSKAHINAALSTATQAEAAAAASASEPASASASALIAAPADSSADATEAAVAAHPAVPPADTEPSAVSWAPPAAEPASAASASAQAQGAEQEAAKAAERQLCRVFAAQLGLPPSQVRPDIGFFELGLQSAQLLAVMSDLEKELGRALSPTLLFEFSTIAELAAELARQSGAQIAAGENAAVTANAAPTAAPAAAAGGEDAVTSSAGPPQDAPPAERLPERRPAAASGASAAYDAPASALRRAEAAADEDIAIVGMAGRFPGAADLRQFWRNLLEGKDCITEVPPERWDWKRLSGFKSPSGRPVSRWGGFIEDADCFDPYFFRIAPREAEILDPQERLFLQACWEAIEDAGYVPKTLVSPKGSGHKRNVGVFVGVMHKDYTLIAAEALARGLAIPLSLNYAPIANRVSYFCNFHGPSLAVDTVCSSSLVAVHLAIDSIRKGESEVALAGGVNLSLHPNKYITYGMANMHATDGYCHAFGKGGDGYVSSDGIGVVLLKPLSKAQRDGDHIYAVIKGAVTNHGGAASGITVPNPAAQAELIAACHEQTGIDPRTVGYVEAHGTGTSLGDPIEMQGLIKAYRQHTADTQFCAIGSVKSNIGHAESAAGISGLIKNALQLYHQTLVPSLHAEELNPYIDFTRSPFYVQRQAEPWKQPVLQTADGEIVFPRRAGLSSFGATGTNVHILMEERPQAAAAWDAEQRRPAPGPYLVPLSAKTADRLQAVATRLLGYLEEAATGQKEPLHLENLAYTLQVGREAMEERAAFIADDLDDLRRKLESFVRGEAGAYRGRTQSAGDPLAYLLADEDACALVRTWLEKRKLEAVAQFWAGGGEVDWLLMYPARKPDRVSLPAYPFVKERFWIPEAPAQADASSAGNSRLPAAAAALHPLVQRNTSDFSGLRFSSSFSAEDGWLQASAAGGGAGLPPAALWAMAQAAAAFAVNDSSAAPFRVRLLDAVCSAAPDNATAADRFNVHVSLFLDEQERIHFDICGDAAADGQPAVEFGYGCAEIKHTGEEEAEWRDVPALLARCGADSLQADAVYELLAAAGAACPAGYQTVGAVYRSPGLMVVRLALPADLQETAPLYGLHPALPDGALQAVLAGMLASGAAETAPASVQCRSISTTAGFDPNMWAVIVPSGGEPGELDIELCSDGGRVCARLSGVAWRSSSGALLDASASLSAADAGAAARLRRPVQPEAIGSGDAVIVAGVRFASEIERLKAAVPAAAKPALSATAGSRRDGLQAYTSKEVRV